MSHALESFYMRKAYKTIKALKDSASPQTLQTVNAYYSYLAKGNNRKAQAFLDNFSPNSLEQQILNNQVNTK